MFDASSLAVMKGAMGEYVCRTPIDILRDYPETDSLGGITSDFRTINTVNGYVKVDGGSESVDGNAFIARADCVLYLQSNVDVLPKDRCVVKDKNNTTTYTVTDVRHKRSQSIFTIVYCNTMNDDDGAGI